MRLPLAPTSNMQRFPSIEAGIVRREHLQIPHTVPHAGGIGLFGEATIPLVVPSGYDVPAQIPKVASIPEIHIPMPRIPGNLRKGLTPCATKLPFGMARVEKHPKKDIPTAFRG